MEEAIKRIKVGATALVLIATLATGCRSYLSRLSFDTSYTPPADWKLVQEGKWGLQFHVPSSVSVEGYPEDSGWVYAGSNLRVIVNYDGKFSPESLRRKSNYVEARMIFNGLKALVCSYDEDASRGQQFKKRMALYFLESRKTLSPGAEPAYIVEYASDAERATALRILQTVRFFDS